MKLDLFGSIQYIIPIGFVTIPVGFVIFLIGFVTIPEGFVIFPVGFVFLQPVSYPIPFVGLVDSLYFYCIQVCIALLRRFIGSRQSVFGCVPIGFVKLTLCSDLYQLFIAMEWDGRVLVLITPDVDLTPKLFIGKLT